MKTRTRFAATVALVVAGAFASATAKDASPAEALFTQYHALERAFDPAVADLYCDAALIRNTRRYPDGNARSIEIPAPKYKELIRASMPLAKERGDFSTYSDVRYAPEGDNVRITATRFSEMKKYSSPISLLVGACDGRDWGILEELSESQP